MLLRFQEILFYSIPSEKEIAGGAKPELLKRFPSGHEETVTKILLLDVDKVRRARCGVEIVFYERLSGVKAARSLTVSPSFWEGVKLSPQAGTPSGEERLEVMM